MSNYTKQELQDLLDLKDEQIKTLSEKIEQMQKEENDLRDEIEIAKESAAMAIHSFESIENSFFWKITKPARSGLDSLKDVVQMDSYIQMMRKVEETLKEHGVLYTARKIKTKLVNAPSYSRWIKTIVPSEEELEKQRKTHFDKDIKFSILVPLYNTPEKFLREMIESVRSQTYTGWELCLADGSDEKHPEVGRICKEYASRDNRVKYKKLTENLGISGNTNACLEMATGNYIALFDHDDILHPSALYEMMKRICDKDADVVYTDEMVFISPNINRIKTIHFKPDYAPDNLRSNNYICHFTAFRKTLLDKTGFFRSECDGSQDHDLIMRLTEQAEIIEHIPKVLYYWRAHPQSVAMSNSAKSYASEGGKRAVLDSVERMGLSARLLSSRTVDSIYRIRYNLVGKPKISIVISNQDKVKALRRCINSIIEKTTYENYEIIIIDNNSVEAETQRYYASIGNQDKVKIVKWSGDNNESLICNYGVSEVATGDQILLLGCDTEIITNDWIEEMLMYSQRRDVGAAGAILHYPDDTVFSAGMILGKGGTAAPAFTGLDRDDVGYMGRMCYAQNLSAVSSDCMLVRRDVWDRVGGLDEEFPDALKDVDMCMRIRKAGYLIAWTPFAEVYKHVAKRKKTSKGQAEQKANADYITEKFISRWSEELQAGDPYYNPNCTLDINRRDFSLK